jgi:hypothetical protein
MTHTHTHTTHTHHTHKPHTHTHTTHTHTPHTHTHTLGRGSPERGIGPSQKTVPDNTQHSQQTDIHVSGGIWTRSPNQRAATDRRRRPRGTRRRLLGTSHIALYSYFRSHNSKRLASSEHNNRK